MARVIVTASWIPPDDPAFEPLTADGHAIELIDGLAVRSAPALIDALQGAAAALASTEAYTAEVLAETPDLQVISRTGVGYDAIDVDEATRRGVVVCTTPGTNQHSVADLAVGLILYCLREIGAAADLVRGNRWAPQPVGRELRASTVGVVGTGLIGREVIKRLAGFEPRVIAYDVVQAPELVERYGIEYLGMDELLRQSDVLTLHAPLLPETRALIDARALALMKPTAYLVNTARGPLVDEVAVADALHRGRIAGAALDVFEAEPLPGTSPLRQAPNVLLTPHIAGLTRQSRESMAAMAIQNIARVLRGEPPLSCVNPAALSVRQSRLRSAVKGG